MEILRVVGNLVCTQRVSGLAHCSLRVLSDTAGKIQVATDPVGARPGNWVFTTNGTAARLAMGDPKILTDLTIGGIIDQWEDSTTTAGALRPAEAGQTETRAEGPAAHIKQQET
jgi:ethanolamine utilization protein EutN